MNKMVNKAILPAFALNSNLFQKIETETYEQFENV